ncbi:uncharacterized protein LOC106773116 [Vigna radiata var. radiata]|uniref:Uncharacterized protein LOC106773116 n=1 Tax=Vigna radiata var. radiata TaxID=3916 RepID=A0A1S3VAQ0_VIGRR|nr:uncharacterized protein LOC106773116 [Vigna radiata var. radiata]
MADFETNLSTEAEEENLMAMIATDIDDPYSFEEACKSKRWREAMDTEMARKEQHLGACTMLSKDENGVVVDATKFRQVIGSLMYLKVTRPDLMFGVNLISKFMANPKVDNNQKTLKDGKSDLIAYSDSDYAGDLDDRTSTSGSVFIIGSTTVSWASRKQPVVADIMTKPLKLDQFERIRSMLEVMKVTKVS